MPETIGPLAALSERRKLAIFLVMAIGQFMALLDIQIVAASMSAIQAGLSAAPDEISWLQTAYLMAEIVMIPLSAYLCEALSTRWMFVASAGLFTATSLLCGLAWSLPSMVALRALQGFVGGAMVPMVFATGFAFFDGPRRSTATAALGVISTLAPTIGPSLGGWITAELSWRWLFFINVAPGLVITVALAALGPFDRAEPARLARIDWLHAAALALSLGGLQFVLEEGPRRGWFGDDVIRGAAWISLVASVVFVERCLRSDQPLVRLDPFRRRGFLSACALAFAVGFGIYAIVYLTPVFLARVRSYDSLQIGATVFIAGVFMTLSAPAAAFLSNRFDLRLVVLIGLCLYGATFAMMSRITDAWGFGELLWPQAVRGAALLCCMVSSVGLAMNAVPESEYKEASGLSSLMRNLGGAVGIALVNTWLIDSAALHGARLAADLGIHAETAREQVGELVRALAVSGGDLRGASVQGLATAEALVSRAALTLAFSDVFRMMAWTFIGFAVFVPFCRGGSMAGPVPPATPSEK